MPRSVAEAAAVLMKRRRVVLMAKFPIKVEQEYAITNHRRGKIALLLDRYPRFRHRAMETEGAAYRRDLSESWKQGAAINAPRKRWRCAIYTHKSREHNLDPSCLGRSGTNAEPAGGSGFASVAAETSDMPPSYRMARPRSKQRGALTATHTPCHPVGDRAILYE